MCTRAARVDRLAGRIVSLTDGLHSFHAQLLCVSYAHTSNEFLHPACEQVLTECAPLPLLAVTGEAHMRDTSCSHLLIRCKNMFRNQRIADAIGGGRAAVTLGYSATSAQERS